MKIKFRELVNPLILNEGYDKVGFQGDSEYIREDGSVKMGFWEFVDVMIAEPTNSELMQSQLEEGEIDSPEEFEGHINWTLDDEIHEELLYRRPCLPFEVENDNGELCLVKFLYHKNAQMKHIDFKELLKEIGVELDG